MENLVAKYLSGNASKEEQAEVEKWRSESAENASQFVQFKEAWLWTMTPQTNQKILDDLLQEKEAKVVAWPSFVKYAAAILLIGMIGVLWFNQNGTDGSVTQVFAGTSEELEDGTIISLKDGAEILSSEITGETRTVRVKGKVFFEVAHDESKPFFVLTENARVQVLGTSFLVNSSDGFTEVCVESGKVKFGTKSENRDMSLDLVKGEMGIAGKDIRGIVKRKISDQNFLAWKDGLLTFERTRVKDVIGSLEDTYGKRVELPVHLQNCQLTAKFQQKTLEEVIQILSATFNWEYKIEKDKVVLSGEGC